MARVIGTSSKTRSLDESVCHLDLVRTTVIPRYFASSAHSLEIIGKHGRTSGQPTDPAAEQRGPSGMASEVDQHNGDVYEGICQCQRLAGGSFDAGRGSRALFLLGSALRTPLY